MCLQVYKQFELVPSTDLGLDIRYDISGKVFIVKSCTRINFDVFGLRIGQIFISKANAFQN